jgi:hypothetical protein
MLRSLVFFKDYAVADWVGLMAKGLENERFREESYLSLI